MHKVIFNYTVQIATPVCNCDKHKLKYIVFYTINHQDNSLEQHWYRVFFHDYLYKCIYMSNMNVKGDSNVAVKASTRNCFIDSHSIVISTQTKFCQILHFMQKGGFVKPSSSLFYYSYTLGSMPTYKLDALLKDGI